MTFGVVYPKILKSEEKRIKKIFFLLHRHNLKRETRLQRSRISLATNKN